jgi:putative aldouronate transport system permease protein
MKHSGYKRINQTIVYFPHFISWVVTASLTFFLLSTTIGAVNKLILSMGYEAIPFLTNQKYFWGIIVGQTIWKETGYGTIIFLSAITGIDLALYEAAEIDGATRLQRIWHITLPGIAQTIVILLILRMGQVFEVGFDQILLMRNSSVRDAAEVFDTYAYAQGITQGQYSIGSAVGLFKGGIGLIFLVASNRLAKRLGSEGIF